MTTVKKMPQDVDNFSENEKKRYELLKKIKEMIENNYSYQDIAASLGISTRTVCRYKECNPLEQCRLERPSRKKEIQKYEQGILTLIKEGYHAALIADVVQKSGCKSAKSTIRNHIGKIAKKYDLEINKNRKGPNLDDVSCLKKNLNSKIHIKKADILKFLWRHIDLPDVDCKVLYEKYPVIHELKVCIEEFREIYTHRSMPRLYLFIERYKKDQLSPIASFAKGLEKDIAAVENSVSSPLSNGFVEGINNRTKTIKRIMYGRCSKELLSAKIMLPYAK